jgi:hypothetical protein
VQRAVDRLEALSIVAQVGEAKRDRVYCAKELLAILDEPAQLVAEGVRQGGMNTVTRSQAVI